MARPSLGLTDLQLHTGALGFAPSYGEYSDLFVRDGLDFLATGGLGNDETRFTEVGGTALIGRASISTGYFHYETRGFRESFDLEHDIFSALGQVALTEAVSAQVEYRRRDTRQGDRELRFDLDDFRSTLTRAWRRISSGQACGMRPTSTRKCSCPGGLCRPRGGLRLYGSDRAISRFGGPVQHGDRGQSGRLSGRS